MRNEEINSKIVTLWNKYFKNDQDVYAPLFYDEFKKGGLLFVGMNPSLVHEDLGQSFRIRNIKT